MGCTTLPLPEIHASAFFLSFFLSFFLTYQIISQRPVIGLPNNQSEAYHFRTLPAEHPDPSASHTPTNNRAALSAAPRIYIHPPSGIFYRYSTVVQLPMASLKTMTQQTGEGQNLLKVPHGTGRQLGGSIPSTPKLLDAMHSALGGVQERKSRK